MQRLIPRVYRIGLYFRKKEAEYSAYRLLHLKERHEFLKKLCSVKIRAAWNEVRE
jgi:hypothetical protein